MTCVLTALLAALPTGLPRPPEGVEVTYLLSNTAPATALWLRLEPNGTFRGVLGHAVQRQYLPALARQVPVYVRVRRGGKPTGVALGKALAQFADGGPQPVRVFIIFE